MKVQIFKLQSGEEFIGELVPEGGDADNTLVRKPVVLVRGRDPETGAEKWSFNPWIQTSSQNDYMIDNSKIVGVYDPIKEIKAGYEQNFSRSGIVTPPEKEILLKG